MTSLAERLTALNALDSAMAMVEATDDDGGEES